MEGSRGGMARCALAQGGPKRGCAESTVAPMAADLDDGQEIVGLPGEGWSAVSRRRERFRDEQEDKRKNFGREAIDAAA